MSGSGSRIVVLGGSGFIGTRLVRRLASAGHDVLVGDIAPFNGVGARYLECDVRSAEALTRALQGADVVYNLAAEHKDNVRPVEKYYDVNVGGARRVCQVAASLGIRRLVFTSSVAVYGIPVGPADENAPCRPFNDYGRSKLEAEAVYRAWAAEGTERALTIVRPTVVFGEGNRGNVYNLARQVAGRAFVMIGDGRNYKSMAYVENVAGFLEHVLSSQRGVQVFNYADTPDLEMNELVSMMKRSVGKDPRLGVRVPYPLALALARAADGVALLTGRELPISSVRVRKFCASTQIRAERAFGTGFSPAFTLQAAVQRFFETEFR